MRMRRRIAVPTTEGSRRDRFRLKADSQVFELFSWLPISLCPLPPAGAPCRQPSDFRREWSSKFKENSGLKQLALDRRSDFRCRIFTKTQAEKPFSPQRSVRISTGSSNPERVTWPARSGLRKKQRRTKLIDRAFTVTPFRALRVRGEDDQAGRGQNQIIG